MGCHQIRGADLGSESQRPLYMRSPHAGDGEGRCLKPVPSTQGSMTLQECACLAIHCSEHCSDGIAMAYTAPRSRDCGGGLTCTHNLGEAVHRTPCPASLLGTWPPSAWLQACQHNPDLVDLVSCCLMSVWMFFRFTATRFLSVGFPSRTLIAGLFTGLENLVDHIRKEQKGSLYFLNGFVV